MQGNLHRLWPERISSCLPPVFTTSQLERYTAVKEWDQGYLVVSAKYKNMPQEEEEYIDLVPILKNLYFDATEFLSPIESVIIQYE